jgi:hypothetical protein
MSWFIFQGNDDSNMAAAERLLSRFGFTASADGVLRIRPAGPVLSYDELDTILKRVMDERVDRQVAEIVLDFGTVEWIEVPWTAVFARLIDFARRTQVRCRLAALHGQPAAVVSFFSGDRVIRSLLRVDKLSPAPTDRSMERASA